MEVILVISSCIIRQLRMMQRLLVETHTIAKIKESATYAYVTISSSCITIRNSEWLWVIRVFSNLPFICHKILHFETTGNARTHTLVPPFLPVELPWDKFDCQSLQIDWNEGYTELVCCTFSVLRIQNHWVGCDWHSWPLSDRSRRYYSCLVMYQWNYYDQDTSDEGIQNPFQYPQVVSLSIHCGQHQNMNIHWIPCSEEASR